LPGKGHKITEPSAQIPTLFRKEFSGMKQLEKYRHKITEPSAQIPTTYTATLDDDSSLSQNNRAFRSNPNRHEVRRGM